MKVLSWNINAGRSISDERLQNVLGAIRGSQADVVLLQEVGWKKRRHKAVLRGLEELGLSNVVYSGRPGASRKTYGCVIASSRDLDVTPTKWGKSSDDPLLPELMLRATVRDDGGDVDVITCHVPNAAGNGWLKVYTFEALARVLTRSSDGPRVLGGDFNEPRAFLADGRVRTFGQKVSASKVHCDGVKTDKKGDAYPRLRWDLAVRAVLAGESLHGLRNAYVKTHGYDVPASHYIEGKKGRCFDHLLVSPELEVHDAGYELDWLTAGWSDHAAVWANLTAK